MSLIQGRWLHRFAVFVVMISAAGVAGAQAAPALADPNGGTPASSCKAKVATLKELKSIREKQITALRKELGVKEVAPPSGAPDDKADGPGMHPAPPPPSCTSQRRTLDALIVTYDKQIVLLKRQVADKKAAADSDTRSAADAGRG